MGLKDRADMTALVLWIQFREAGKAAVASLHEFGEGIDACLEQISGSEV